MSNENKESPEDRIGLDVNKTITSMMNSINIVKESLTKYSKCTIDIANDEDTSQVWNNMTENEKSALFELVSASQIMDELFSIQSTGKPLSVWQEGVSSVVGSDEKNNETSSNLHDFVRINIGPWDRLTPENCDKMGVGQQPQLCNFYPNNLLESVDKDSQTDMSAKDKFDKLLENEFGSNENKNELIKLAHGYFSVLSNKNGKLEIIPYKTEYYNYVNLANQKLNTAADYLIADERDLNNNKHAGLIGFLRKRADNFLNDIYSESDALWIQVDDPVFDITIGPYEVYEDHIFNKKACFESFICLKDTKSSADLQTFRKYLQTLENNLPNVGGDKYFSWARNAEVKPNYIVAVNQIGRGGDCAGPQTAAYNLPNDEAVCKEYGNKLVILKNIQKLKFNNVLARINTVAMVKEQQQFVTFNSFFTHILCHEMCHSLGPHDITLADGTKTTVRNQLTSMNSSIEEAKADIAGLWSLIYLMLESAEGLKSGKSADEVAFPECNMFDIVSVLVTFLASAFRSIRFGVHEAHGKGQVIQMNYILSQNGFGMIPSNENDNDDVRFKVNFDEEKELFDNLQSNPKMEIDKKYIETVYNSIGNCANTILSIQGEGNAIKAKELIDEYATPNKETLTILENLKSQNIPVDIYPVYKYP